MGRRGRSGGNDAWLATLPILLPLIVIAAVLGVMVVAMAPSPDDPLILLLSLIFPIKGHLVVEGAYVSGSHTVLMMYSKGGSVDILGFEADGQMIPCRIKVVGSTIVVVAAPIVEGYVVTDGTKVPFKAKVVDLKTPDPYAIIKTVEKWGGKISVKCP